MPYSEKEFEALYIRTFPIAKKLALSLLLDEDEATDIVQGVFLKLWESKVKIETPQAYIIRAVRNSCFDRINALDVREKVKRKISFEPFHDENDFIQKYDEINGALPLLLTSREKEVVDRIYSEGMSYKEAAKNLNVSIATINKNIVSSLKKLRNHFKNGNND